MSTPQPLPAPLTGAVTGTVRLVLRLEGLAALAVATAAYAALGGNWWLYAIVFFMPDLSFVAFTISTRVGATVYNAVHSYLGPAVVGLIGWWLGIDLFWQLALIVAAHIGFDRSLGYGLKYPSAFQHTHLGIMGRRR